MSAARSATDLLTTIGWAVAVPAAALTGYTLIAIGPLLAGLPAIWATIATGVVVTGIVLGIRAARLRWQHPGQHGAPAEASPPAPVTARVWLLLLVGLVLSFLAGQSVGMLALMQFGSENFARSVSARNAHGILPALLLTLVVAPIAEEALMRGLIYPALRRRLSMLVSTTITVAAFGILHTNIVQMLAVVPLSVLLCWIYERTARLVPCIITHGLFNVAAMTVPPEFIAALTTPGLSLCLVALFTAALALAISADRVQCKLHAGPAAGSSGPQSS